MSVRYFVSYAWQAGSSSAFGFGHCAVDVDAPVTGPETIEDMTQRIEAVKPGATVAIINWRRFEDADVAAGKSVDHE